MLCQVAKWAGKELGTRQVLQNMGYVEIKKPGIGVMTIIYDKQAKVAWVNVDLNDLPQELKGLYGWQNEHIYMYVPFDKEPPKLKKPVDLDKWFIYKSREVAVELPPSEEP